MHPEEPPDPESVPKRSRISSCTLVEVSGIQLQNHSVRLFKH